jgi:uncharacterized paraquat-inducible protein A
MVVSELIGFLIAYSCFSPLNVIAGGKSLAIMMFIASFAWPYTKSVVSLVLWFLPTGKCSVSTRGSIFLWLDALAKWSVVDIFVLVVTIVCLKVQIKRYDL